MSVMSSSHIWHEDRPLTVDDLVELPDDGNRYELVNGVLTVTPAPFGGHDLVVHRLKSLLDQACPDGLRVFIGMGFNLTRSTHRVPDLAVVRMAWFQRDSHQTRPPLLAVEVASGSTRVVDRTVKKVQYAAFGIESYWIVAPDVDRPSLTAYELRDGKYERVALVAGSETFEAVQPCPLKIVPSLLVADEEEWRALQG